MVAVRAGVAGALAQDHGGLGGFGQPQPDPYGEQLPYGQGVFGRVLHRGDHRDADRAALGEQQAQQLFDFAADLAVGDIGGQRSDLIDRSRTNSGSDGVGVCRRVWPRSRLAPPVHDLDQSPQQVEGGAGGVVGEHA